MTDSGSASTEDEQRLLKAAIDHAKDFSHEPNLIVRRVPYGFETNLTEHGENILADNHKAR